jgi:putative oxidoreductase
VEGHKVNRTLSGVAADVALLIARLVLGTVMFAHGYQKMFIDGIGRTTQGFEKMSIPAAILSASFVTVVELVGSILVILGALLILVAACYLVVMVGAAVFVHIPNGVFVGDNGWELVGVIAALLLTLAVAGSGRYGVDGWLRSRQARAAHASATLPSPPSAPHPTPRHDYSARVAAFTGATGPQPRVEEPAAEPPTPQDEAVMTLPVRRPARGSSSPPDP